MNNIEYNIHEYQGDSIYISLALNMGIATRYVQYNNEQFECNLAFPNIFVNCLDRVAENKFEYNVDRTITYIHFKSCKQSFNSDLSWFVKTVLRTGFNQETFNNAKEESINKFRKNYKNGQFRSCLKAYEISELNKQFSMTKLITDLETIDFHKFRENQKILVSACNCRIYANGVLMDLGDKENKEIRELLANSDEAPVLGGRLINPYLRTDAHLLEMSREPYNIDILSFCFDQKVSMRDCLIYMLFETEKIPVLDRIMHIDIFDASLIVNEPELQILKIYFKKIISREQFLKIRNLLLAKFQNALELEPIQFNEYYLKMKQNGVSLIECIQIIMNLEYEEYKKNIDAIKPIVTEAQIVLRR